MAKLLIAGGSGLIGQRLSSLAAVAGHEIAHLSRKPSDSAAFPTFAWNIQNQTIDPAALEYAEVIINLAGAGIADKPWTQERKKEIIGSRRDGALFFRNLIQNGEVTPAAYLATAAIGIYGDRGDETLTEESAPGKEGFLAESSKIWEQAIEEVASTGVRTVTFRTGIVLSTRGGALPRILQPMRFGLASYLGDGRQWYAWIHIDDLCQLFLNAIDDAAYQGKINAVAPKPLRNIDFMRELRKIWPTATLLAPAPAFVLRTMFGEMAQTVLSSSRVLPARLKSMGFQFTYPELGAAVRDLLDRQV